MLESTESTSFSTRESISSPTCWLMLSFSEPLVEVIGTGVTVTPCHGLPCLFFLPLSAKLSVPTPSHIRHPDSLNTRRPSTKTKTTTTPTMDVQLSQNTPAADKISAYYSLVFPTITYYLQTPNVTIGRRCIPPNSPSSSTAAPQIDIDLGSLKSVSRLHANIEYDEAEERWVLAVHGRNGAWVDGVWIQPGKRAPLNERHVFPLVTCLTTRL